MRKKIYFFFEILITKYGDNYIKLTDIKTNYGVKKKVYFFDHKWPQKCNLWPQFVVKKKYIFDQKKKVWNF